MTFLGWQIWFLVVRVVRCTQYAFVFLPRLFLKVDLNKSPECSKLYAVSEVTIFSQITAESIIPDDAQFQPKLSLLQFADRSQSERVKCQSQFNSLNPNIWQAHSVCIFHTSCLSAINNDVLFYEMTVSCECCQTERNMWEGAAGCDELWRE